MDNLGPSGPQVSEADVCLVGSVLESEEWVCTGLEQVRCGSGKDAGQKSSLRAPSEGHKVHAESRREQSSCWGFGTWWVVVTRGPMAEHHPVRANSFHLASLNPSGVGSPISWVMWSIEVDSLLPHHELKNSQQARHAKGLQTETLRAARPGTDLRLKGESRGQGWGGACLGGG